MAQKYLSKTRQWEYGLKSGDWGFTDAEIGLLPQEFRSRLWAETMLVGPRMKPPSEAVLAEAEVLLEAAYLTD
jgi:hypothetical protein